MRKAIFKKGPVCTAGCALCVVLLLLCSGFSAFATQPEGNGTFRAAVGGNGSVTNDLVVSPQTEQEPYFSAGDSVNSTTQDAQRPMPLPSSSWGNYFQAIGFLLLILGGLYMGIWALKRFGKLHSLGGRFSRHGVSVEGQFHLGPKKSLVVVRFLNKRLLLGVTDHQINLLTEMEAEHDPTNEPSAADFKTILEDADKQGTSS